MDVRSVLEHCGLSEAHFNAIAEAVPEGYAALARLAKETPMLSQFLPGHLGLGHLRNVAVQYALQTKAASTELFFTRDAWNAAHNHPFLQLQVGQVVLTTHYCGAKGSRSVRRAVTRAELAQRTSDLFHGQSAVPDMEHAERSAYAQIVHGGVHKAKLIAIKIPNMDQQTYTLRAMSLTPVEPSAARVEEVADQLHQAIKRRKPAEVKDVG